MQENFKQPDTVLVQPEGEKCATAMHTLTLIYHIEFEPQIVAIINQRMSVARYTKIGEVIGARSDSLEGADYDPKGHNQMLVIIAEKRVIHELVEDLREFRARKRHGIRGFVTPVEEVI